MYKYTITGEDFPLKRIECTDNNGHNFAIGIVVDELTMSWSGDPNKCVLQNVSFSVNQVMFDMSVDIIVVSMTCKNSSVSYIGIITVSSYRSSWNRKSKIVYLLFYIIYDCCLVHFAAMPSW